MIVMRIFIIVIVIESNRGWELLFAFLEKITSFVYFLGSGFSCIFHWKAYLLIFSKSEFNSFADISISWSFDKRKVLSAKVYILMLFHQEDHSWKSKIEEVLILTLLVLQSLFFSNQKFNYLMLLFVHDYQDNL